MRALTWKCWRGRRRLRDGVATGATARLAVAVAVHDARCPPIILNVMATWPAAPALQTIDDYGSDAATCRLPYFAGGTISTDSICGGMNADVMLPAAQAGGGGGSSGAAVEAPVAQAVVFRNSSGWLHVTLLLR